MNRNWTEFISNRKYETQKSITCTERHKETLFARKSFDGPSNSVARSFSMRGSKKNVIPLLDWSQQNGEWG